MNTRLLKCFSKKAAVFSMSVLMLPIASCHKPPVNPAPENELITTLKLTAVDSATGTSYTFQFEDIDGDGVPEIVMCNFGNKVGSLSLFKKDKSNNNQADRLSLSENEMTFLKLASTDMTYKEIATMMKISPRTVDNYRDALFIKLNVKSRVGLAMVAIRHGVVTF